MKVTRSHGDAIRQKQSLMMTDLAPLLPPNHASCSRDLAKQGHYDRIQCDNTKTHRTNVVDAIHATKDRCVFGKHRDNAKL